jgi:hypothetical protein
MMARGFESKSVADQQEARAAEKPVRSDVLSPDQKRLQLARADVEQRLRTATSGPHRAMLQMALKAIDEQAGKS